MNVEWFQTANGYGFRERDNEDAGWLWSDNTIEVSP